MGELPEKIDKMGMVGFALEFGFAIAIPLLISYFVGQYLLSLTGSKVYLYILLVVSLASSIIWIYRIIKPYIPK